MIHVIQIGQRFTVPPGPFPLGNLSACNRKHEIDQNPEWTQPKLFTQGEHWGRAVV